MKELEKLSEGNLLQRLDRVERRIWTGFHRHVLAYLPRSYEPSPVPTTLVFALAAKDIPHAEATVAAWRKYLLHPIAETVIAGQNHPDVAQFASRIGARYVNEDDILTDSVKAFRRQQTADGYFRPNGWVRQQFMKMSAVDYCSTDTMVIADTDTRPIRPVSFWSKGRPMLLIGDDYMVTYNRFIERTFGPIKIPRRSFTTHCWFRERDIALAMREELSTRFRMPWQDAVLTNLDPEESECFAECHTYGTYAVNRFPGRVQTRYWYNTKAAATARAEDDVQDFVVSSRLSRFSFASRHVR